MQRSHSLPACIARPLYIPILSYAKARDSFGNREGCDFVRKVSSEKGPAEGQRYKQLQRDQRPEQIYQRTPDWQLRHHRVFLHRVCRSNRTQESDPWCKSVLVLWRVSTHVLYVE